MPSDPSTTMIPGCLPIEQAPKDKTIRATIWHGERYYEVRARWASKAKAWLDTDPDSCVGWVEGVSKPAFFQPEKAP